MNLAARQEADTKAAGQAILVGGATPTVTSFGGNAGPAGVFAVTTAHGHS